MRRIIATLLLLACSFAGPAQVLDTLLKGFVPKYRGSKTEILLLGSTHFNQDRYKNNPKADLFSPTRQAEVAALIKNLKAYKPDLILVERTPEEQITLDSLYALYQAGKLALQDLPHGRSEQYQFGFRLAKELKLERIFGADYYESVSSRILTEGSNIQYFQKELDAFSQVGREADTRFQEGRLSLKDFLLFINTPSVLDLAYRVMFLNPARVRNGRFTNAPAQYVDSACITPAYIGAEYISLFYERELKIYSNIVTTQLDQKSKRILLIMGHRHAAVLTKIFEEDPAYKVIPLSTVLK
ncbi:MAG TPA: DUF5694 domain-containing protein [Flavisolibacter sp.]|nr:DUF5694 domain-containing protein [Flavisolibacter sp.]